jgi:hypothetical protein
MLIGRLAIAPPLQWNEQMGDPMTNLGGSPIPAPRAAVRHAVSIATLAPDGATDTVAARLVIRRQIRSMLNNTPLKLQAYIYLQYADDPEQNGWYLPDMGQLADGDASAGLSTGFWKVENFVWYLAGTRWTNREARNVWLKDLRTGLYARDTMRWVYSTDFSALPALALTIFPSGATSISNTVNGQEVLVTALPVGRDGGQAQVASGLVDLACCAYERVEASLNLSDVIVYDRQGANMLANALATSGSVADWTNNPNNAAATLSWVTTAPLNIGTGEMQVVTSGSLASQGAGASVGMVSAGTYTFSAYLRGNAGGESVVVNFSIPGTVGGSTTATLTTAWQRFSFTVTITAAQAAIGPLIAAVFTNGSHAYTFFVNAAQVTATSSVTAFADAAPAVGPDPAWAEVYGPSWPWSWMEFGAANDCPVLENGLCRVRYDGTNTPGFRIDVWNSTAYVEQGKVLVYRNGDVSGYCNTFVSATLHTDSGWTPDRVVVAVTLANSADSSSRERVFITMQRGQAGATFEIYPALRAAATNADCILIWEPAPTDVNVSVCKIDSQAQPPAVGSGVIVATAGSGSSLWAGGAVGVGNFTASENDIAMLRCSATATLRPYQVNLAVVQAANAWSYATNEASAYGPTNNCLQVLSQNSAGYVSVDISFAPTASDQVNEAESIRNVSGTTSQVADATASGGQCVKDTQTAATNLTLTKSVTTLLQGKYRVFARVKVDSGATGTFLAIIPGVASGTNVTSTSTTWAWIDLGELLTTSLLEGFALWAWRSSPGTGAVYVDRVELFLLEDRTSTTKRYGGMRDLGQSVLYDSRQTGAVVAR